MTINKECPIPIHVVNWAEHAAWRMRSTLTWDLRDNEKVVLRLCITLWALRMKDADHDFKL